MKYTHLPQWQHKMYDIYTYFTKISHIIQSQSYQTKGISATWNPTGEVSLASSSRTPSECSTSRALTIASGDGECVRGLYVLAKQTCNFLWTWVKVI